MVGSDEQQATGKQRLGVCAVWIGLAFACRAWMLRRFAVNVPYWDQWDAEVVELYHKVLDGSLAVGDLFAPANEHRIVLTRLLHLALFYLNGEQMNTVHGMLAQAGVQVATLGVVLWALNGRRLLWTPSLLVTAAFMLPVSWENIYWSYQSQVYFAIFFAVLAAAAAARQHMAFWTALVSVLAGGATMASGAFTALTVAAAYLHRSVNQPQHRRRAASAVGLFVVLAWGVTRITWRNPGHAYLQATNVTEFLFSLGRYLTWPRAPATGLGLVPWACGAVYAWRHIVRGRPASYTQRFGLLLFVWVGLACAAAAYARSNAMSNRYFDYTMLTYIAAIVVSAEDIQARWAPAAAALFYAALALPLACVTVISVTDATVQLDRRRAFAQQVTQALAAGQGGADAAYAYLQNPPMLGYPDAHRLAGILADPRTRHILRKLLPAEIKSE